MSGELYTYKRVLKDGQWVMERTPATGTLANGAPVFPKISPDQKVGTGAYSAMMDHLLGRYVPPIYTTTNTSSNEHTVHIPIIIDSDTLKQRGMLGKMLVARLHAYSERGFKWVLEAETGNGPGKVSMLNERLGQLFIVYFKHQEELARWAMGEDIRPYRIERKLVPFSGAVGDNIPIPEGEDPVDFVVTGGHPTKSDDSGFARKVELEEG